MKKTLILLSIGMLIISCERKENEDNDNTPIPKSTESIASQSAMDSISVTQELFDAQRKSELYKTGQYKIDSLVIIPLDKSEIKFTGRPNSEFDYAEYDYIGNLRTTGFHLVSHQSHEHYETFLIDQSSGEIDTLWGNQPTVNITDEIIIAKSMEYGLEGVPNGFQVWKMNTKRKWKKIAEINQELWVCDEIRISNTIPAFFIVKRISLEDLNSKNPKYEYMKYSIK